MARRCSISRRRFTGSNPRAGHAARVGSGRDARSVRRIPVQRDATAFYFGAGVSYTASYYLHRRDFVDLGRQRLRSPRPAGASRLSPGRRADVRAAGADRHADRAADAAGRRRTAPPTVKARCEPCTVEVNRQLTASADAQDPDGDTLRYRWTSPTGIVRQRRRSPDAVDRARPGRRRAADRDGRRRQGHDGDAIRSPCRSSRRRRRGRSRSKTCTSTSTATRCAPKRRASSTKPSRRCSEDRTCASRLKATPATSARPNTTWRSASAARAAVRDYLVSRGINASRLQTVSYGEERPKHDNAREETRRLNRRAALTIRLQ